MPQGGKRDTVQRATAPVVVREQHLKTAAVRVHQHSSGTNGKGTTLVGGNSPSASVGLPLSASSASAVPACTEIPTTCGNCRPVIGTCSVTSPVSFASS